MLTADNYRNETWRVALRTNMRTKDRASIPRVRMPELDPIYRIQHQDAEVNSGLTLPLAQIESQRCLDCVHPSCVTGCPVGIDIPRFVKQIEGGQILEAAKTLKESSTLPAVCGRVCPQERQCEQQCVYNNMKKEPVAIGYLERFAADYAREKGENFIPSIATANGIKIAVVGSGPAGLAFASDMAKLGYEVVIFEALHEIGGVLRYGIPEFRLPREVVAFEVQNVQMMGVRFVTNYIVGKTITIEDLKKEGFRGIFVGSGAGLPQFMHIPGENLVGVMSANEYLTRINLMNAGNPNADTPVFLEKRVAVIGGGNTAMDAVRTAKRLGATRAMIVYRRSEAEMPARIEEVHHAKMEGIEFLTLHNPIEFIGDENGRVTQMLLQVMELGTPDSSGRRSPVPIEGQTKIIEVDTVIISIGVSPNPLIPQSIKELQVTKWGTIIVDKDSMQSSIPFVFAGGDIVRGGATVILAMGDGKKAAHNMDEWLKKQ